jgi:peroxiredoxin
MKYVMIGVWIMASMLFFSCGGNESASAGKVLISGKIENAPQGVVVLSQLSDSRPKVLDTLDLNNKGEFTYELEVATPTFYELNIHGQKIVRLALLDEDVTVNYDFANPEDVTVEGSSDTKELMKLEKLMQNYQAEVNKLNEAYYEAMSTEDSEAMKNIQMEGMNFEAKHADRVKETIESMGDSFASLAALSMLNPKQDFQFVDQLVAKLNENYPGTTAILQAKQQLDEMRALSVGQPAPDIELPNPDGRVVKLSDLRGKYVLIDFWAAWCKPCRQENPHVVKLYNQYKDKGFEVYGVSLDRTKEDWVKAIADDGLEWTQVSDLKYFNSIAAELYQIEAIPATYMIDREGKIIAKDLRGPSLESKLAELFN